MRRRGEPAFESALLDSVLGAKIAPGASQESQTMIFRKYTAVSLALALVVATSLPASAASGFLHFGGKKQQSDPAAVRKLTPSQSALIDRAIVREHAVVAAVKDRAPLVETYIQNMRPDPVVTQYPASDRYFLDRVQFSKVIADEEYQINPSTAHDKAKRSAVSVLKNPLSFFAALRGDLQMTYQGSGFVQMLLVDSNSFDRSHYTFSFVQNQFLGNVPTSVFDVTPSAGKGGKGHFFGRIWVETRGANIVRFNGSFTGSVQEHREFYHFDSWRANVQADMWLPTAFYVEESDPNSGTRTLKFKAVSHIWGYQLKVLPPDADSSATSLSVVGATDVADTPDVSPLGAQREWVQQAEDNAVERLFQAGIIDAPSEFDKTLEALANNILVYNNVTLSRPIRCRTMLTEPLESSAIGNTILLSKSLIDSTAVVTQDGLQQAGNLNALLAFQLAHIILGHRLDTKFAFNDTLIFPTITVFNRISMHHSDADNAEAAKKAVQLLGAKELVDGQQYFGLFLKQLQQHSKALLSLNAPRLGDALVKSDVDPTFWMAPLIAKAPKLDVKDVKQQAAMPLDSFLRFDPWTDQVAVMHSSFEPILGAPDMMPLEVAPIYLKLSYFEPKPGDIVTRVISVVQSAPAPTDSEPKPDATGKQ
jgi:hypothetical protein